MIPIVIDDEAPDEDEPGEYRVVFSGTATTYIDVEADNASDAVNKAEDLLDDALCFACGHPQGSARDTGSVEREYPENMVVERVTGPDGERCDPGDY